MRTFGDNIRTAREKAGKTQKETAEFVGVAQSVYCQYESSYKAPNVYIAKKIADYLGVTLNDLLGGDTA